ncbi:MAG: VPLPA-CTERM sorting domain-containing protein [Pseudomonadota bacterium]
MKAILFLCAGIAILATSNVHAATVNLRLNSVYNAPGTQNDDRDDDIQVGEDTVQNNQTLFSASTNIAGNGGTANSVGSVNAATGELKLRVETTLDAPALTFNDINTFATAELSLQEEFTAMGTGFVTFSLLVDGNWSLASLDPNLDPDFLITSSVGVNTIGRDLLTIDENNGPASNAAFSQLLEFTAPVFDTLTYVLTTSLFGQINGNTAGFINFNDTATLDVSFSGGTTGIQFADPSFLSVDPNDTGTPPIDPTSPVPLPAAGWMLIGALGGLGIVKARRRRIST